jgi:hypothetical protein
MHIICHLQSHLKTTNVALQQTMIKVRALLFLSYSLLVIDFSCLTSLLIPSFAFFCLFTRLLYVIVSFHFLSFQPIFVFLLFPISHV